MNLAAIANHIWQSTMVAALAWLLVQVFRKNGARIRYTIWMLASLKFLLPLSLLIALGSCLSWPARGYVATVNAPVIEFIGQPFSQSPFQQEPLVTDLARPAPTRSQNQPATGAVSIWLVGIAWVVISRLIRMQRVRQILSAARRLDDGREIESLARAKNLRGFAQRISCARTESIIEPGIHGVFRPILVLPSGVAERLETAQLDAIMDHELCHIRWYDNLSALIHMAVESIFWFHPLVWWIGTRLIDERERACDEQVLENGGDPKVYASAILKVCEFYVASPLECVAGVSGGNLRKRIEEIMNHRIVQKLSGGKKLLLAGVGIFAAAAPIVVGILNAPAIRAQSQPLMPKFEVASVKPLGPHDSCCGPDVDRQTFALTGSLYDFILHAYHLESICGSKNALGADCPLVSGAPAWIKKEQFNIQAKMADNSPGYTRNEFMQGEAPQIEFMLQELLADRFKLTVHREMRELPVYAIAIGKNGLKLKHGKESALKQASDGNSSPNRSMFIHPGPDGSSISKMTLEDSSMQEFADFLAGFVDRPVLDRTGLKGQFDFMIEYGVDKVPSAGDSGLIGNLGTAGPSMFSALQEQLGLRLESTKGRVDVLIIDHVGRPSEN
jgi:bla regulator protein BlaR1